MGELLTAKAVEAAADGFFATEIPSRAASPITQSPVIRNDITASMVWRTGSGWGLESLEECSGVEAARATFAH